MVVIKWKIFKELDSPCADISYKWVSDLERRLIVTLHFSRVIDGFDKDLELTFSDPIALQWEDEAYGIIELPQDLPRCSQSEFTNWTYPTLIIPNSEWANMYAARSHTAEEYMKHNVTHFAFISMNDLLHVLSEKKPSVKLIVAKNA